MSDAPKQAEPYVHAPIKAALDLIKDGKGVSFHRLSNTFPLMGEEEGQALTEDIRKNGLIEPITLHEGMILDGRNRYLAANAAEHKWTAANFRTLPSGVEPWDYVVSENIQRRHLSGEQKREVISALLKADPKKSDRAIAAVAKVDHKTVGVVRADAVAGGEIPHQESRVGQDGVAQPVVKNQRQRDPAKVATALAKRRETLRAKHAASQAKPVDAAKETCRRLKEQLVDALYDLGIQSTVDLAEEIVEQIKTRLDQQIESMKKEFEEKGYLGEDDGDEQEQEQEQAEAAE
jgi:hypothetical protein